MATEATAATGAKATAATGAKATAAKSARAAGPLVLDRYRLMRRLGSGAFGSVWLARDERLEREVAVKILARGLVGGRFEREARVAARLSHPAIVTLYEAAVDDDGAYLVSELVRGSTLDRLVVAGRLSDRDIVAIAIALCDALGHAHEHGVVHRDVKPSNVLVPDPPLPAGPPAKLTDFGVASVAGGDALTATGDVIGTLAYMAPEQAAGLEAGPAADLYSLSLVTYEALTGVNPLAGAAAQRSRRLGIRLAPLRRQRRDLPRELAHALDRALRPHPRDRGSLTELAIELEAALELVGDEPGVIDAPWAPLVPRPARRSSTSRRPTEAAGADPQDSWAPSPLHWPSEDEPADPNGEAASRRWGSRTAQAPASPRAVAAAPPVAWPPRAVAAAAAAATAAWVAGDVLTTPPLPPAAFALLAAVATMLLPRLGWGAVIVGLCFCTLVAGHTGAALALAIALLAPVLLAPASPAIWPLAAGAPALGLVGLAGLAGAWPALAARAGTIWQRAVLAACGWLWLALAGAITGRALYLPHSPGAPATDAWIDSAHQTVQRLLPSLARTGALAPAIVWAAAAVVLPWAARGRLPALDAIRVAIWAALLAAGTGAAITAAHSGQAVGAAPGAALGAVAAAVVALAPIAALRWRDALRSGGAAARLP